jgi:O-acetyl-ADP-ribose deacetylase (regulator of RNase III)
VSRLEVIKGDITHLDVDAIVNAANSSLLGGGGVDGAIHCTAGPELLEETRRLGGCRTGDAVITNGYNLAARYVIHTVGPVWEGGEKEEARLLASCYRKSLKIASERGFTTVAFPAISTGLYGYPAAEAARVAVNEVTRFLKRHERPERVSLVCLDDRIYSAFARALRLKNG